MVEMLTSIIEDIEHTDTLANLCLSAACLVSYVAFLYFNELVCVQDKDLTF